MNFRISTLIFLSLCSLLVTGCRREDIRVCEIEIQGLTLNNVIQMRKATDALARYKGVDQDSYAWRADESSGKIILSLHYDSMQIAQTNLRMAIAETGLKVIFPDNLKKSGVAGYVDHKPASVE